MGTGCERNGHWQRPVICRVIACAANHGVVVCRREVCRWGCEYIRQLANMSDDHSWWLMLVTSCVYMINSVREISSTLHWLTEWSKNIAQSLMHRHFATVCSRTVRFFTKMRRNWLVTRRMGKFWIYMIKYSLGNHL